MLELAGEFVLRMVEFVLKMVEFLLMVRFPRSG